jgi:hypothetical protein
MECLGRASRRGVWRGAYKGNGKLSIGTKYGQCYTGTAAGERGFSEIEGVEGSESTSAHRGRKAQIVTRSHKQQSLGLSSLEFDVACTDKL